MLRRLYSFLYTLAYPFLVIYLLKRSIKEPLYRQNISQRFGFAPPLENCIWFHCVSLGETVAATPLIQAAQRHWPNHTILLTQTTATGRAKALQLLREHDSCAYLPYDTPRAVRRFLRRVNPKVGIIMETEIWPNLIESAHKEGIPLLLNNARLSNRSTQGYQRIGSIIKNTLNQIHTVHAQTQQDYDNFKQLGADPSRLRVSGNIKFDVAIPPELTQQAIELKKRFNGSFLWVAGSTHAGEEEIIIEAHKRLLTQIPNAQLILVPRHPDRFDAVNQLCIKSTIATTRYSQSAQLDQANIVLGDVMGQLMLFYATSDVCFVGGSLVAIGGHNLIEPASVGKSILSGQYLENTELVAELLEKAGALTKVSDSTSLFEELLYLAGQPKQREARGKQAKLVSEENTGCCHIIIDQIKTIIEPD